MISPFETLLTLFSCKSIKYNIKSRYNIAAGEEKRYFFEKFPLKCLHGK
jgi:hypothetical protein